MSKEPPQVCCNEELEPLEELLAGIKWPGDFFVNGGLEIPMPIAGNICIGRSRVTAST